MKQYPITRATRNGEAQPFRFTPPDPRRHDATLAAAKVTRALPPAPPRGAGGAGPVRTSDIRPRRADWHRREAPPARPLTGQGTMPGTHPDPPGAPPVGDGVPARFGFVARYKAKAFVSFVSPDRT